MKLPYLFAGVLGLLLLAAVDSTKADSCAPVRTYAAPTYQAPAYYQPAATYYPQTLVLGIFVPTPSYTVGVSAGDPAAKESFDAIMRRLDAIEQRQAAPQMLQASRLTSCAKCHTGESAKGGFVFSDQMSAKDKARATQQILSGAMPPKAPLAADQRLAAVEELLK